ncbi:MAG: metallophosphoesterase family protein [Candidatus Omnitrophica bacterium]|nr:metallophosphoesterase family protein [Candidatus Omnitrophota bacterium]
MRYGIFSDVHSNWDALEAVLRELRREKVDRLLCAGDLVGYGADPAACLGELRRQQVISVAGNHDWAAIGKLSADWFNPHARAAVEWTASQLAPNDRVYLEQLPLIWSDSEVTLAHGCLTEPERFHYVLDPGTAAAALSLQKTPLAFIGHTHVPVFFQAAEETTCLPAGKTGVEPGQKWLVNVGSVGQPRDGDSRAAYCLYDTVQRSVEIRRAAYPVEAAQKKIREAGLPEFLARRLEMGA